MDNLTWRALAVVGLVLIGVFFAGCSDTDAPAGVPADTGIVATTTTPGPLYGVGDLVKNPKSSANTALLIIKYDSGTDMYERAYVYPNSDGSLGYRLDTKTDSIDRSVIEKIYTEKIRTVEISTIPIGTSGAVTTTAAPGATSVTTVTTTATATTTTAAYAPRIKGVEPDKGKTGTTVSITELEGQNFLSGANVSLRKSGEPTLHATNVVVTPTLITCDFVIPSDTALGYWDMFVTNPDGQSDKFQNAFLIQEGVATTTTSTTTAASNLVTITQVQDTLLVTGGLESFKTVSILGTNLTAASNMKLTGPGTITASTYSCSSSSLATGYFTIPAGNTGTYYVTLVDASGTVLVTSSGTLTIQ